MSNRRIKLRALVHVAPERAIDVIATALASTGSLPKTSKVLGVGRVTLWRYRQRLDPEKVWAAARAKMRADCTG